VHLEVGVHELEDEVEAPLVRKHVQQPDNIERQYIDTRATVQ